MLNATTLTELIEANRDAPRNIVYLEGDQIERKVPFGELYERALGILYHLQKLGARRGDKLILFLGDNEQFIDAFWAAVLGGIGNIYGAMLGGVLLGLIESLGAGYVGDLTAGFLGSHYQDIFAFIVLVAVLTLRPAGIMGERVADRA